MVRVKRKSRRSVAYATQPLLSVLPLDIVRNVNSILSRGGATRRVAPARVPRRYQRGNRLSRRLFSAGPSLGQSVYNSIRSQSVASGIPMLSYWNRRNSIGPRSSMFSMMAPQQRRSYLRFMMTNGQMDVKYRRKR